MSSHKYFNFPRFAKISKEKINYVDEQVPFHAALNRLNVEVEKRTSAAINSYNRQFKVAIKFSPMDE